MKNRFISTNEKLLIWQDKEDHVSYDDVIETVEDVLAYIDESAVRIFRVSNDFQFEEVTEDVASAFIKKFQPETDDNFKIHGEWLSESQALEDYIDDTEDDYPYEKLAVSQVL